MPAGLTALLIDACLRATPVLAAAWLLTRLMRRASAATRHYLWACAFAGVALVPVAAALTPRWQIPAPAAVRSLSSLMAPEAGRSIARGVSANAPVATPSRRLVSEARSSEPREVPSVGATEDRRGRIVAAITIAWVLGAVVILLYLCLGTLAAWRLRRLAVPIDAPWVDAARALGETVGVRARVRCVESCTVRAPMVSGLWRPTIVMPLDAAHWPDDRLRAVMLHELAHIERRDCFTQLFAQIVCAVYWVNPLVWVAARRLRTERERACDDVVLAAGTKGSDYAGHLLAIATAVRPRVSRFAAAGLSMAHSQQLRGRLSSILDRSLPRGSAAHARLAVIAVVVMMSASVSAVRLQTAAPLSTAPAMESTVDRHPSVPLPAFMSDTTSSGARIAVPSSTAAPGAVVTLDSGQPSAAREAIEAGNLGAQAQVQPRTFLLIVDDLHLDFRSTPRLRQIAGRLLRSLVRDGDLCGVVTTGSSGISMAPTSELTALESAIPHLTGNALKLSELRDPTWQLITEQEMPHRAVVASSTAANAIDLAAAGQGGRPFAVLYLSSGYDVRFVPVPIELLRAALRANAAIHTIDPRGFGDTGRNLGVFQAEWDASVEATKGSLSALASQTKGTAVFTPEDLDALLSRLAQR